MIEASMMGALLLLASGIAASLWSVHAERTRILTLTHWIDLIALIREEIDCYLTPLEEIFARSNSPLVQQCRSVGLPPSAYHCLRHSSPSLGEEERRILSSFLRELGSVYREEQVRRCDRALDSLRSILERRERELPQRIRLSVTLCLCAAMGTAVLLW